MEIIISLVSIAVLITVVSFSYAYIKLEKQEKDVNVLGTDCIKLEMEDVSEGITLHHAFPVIDETGQQTDPYTFKLTNQCGVGVNYEIHLRVEEAEEDQIAASNIATSVDGEEKVKLTNKVSTEGQPEEYKINKEDLTLDPYETVEHNVRIWLDESAGNETQNKTFKSKVIIEAVQNQTAMYTEKILNGADPVLYNTSKEPIAMLTASGEEPTTTDTLVPVEIDETTGKVTKADVTEEWYDYETKRWANAVILVDNSQADTIQPGEEIDEKDIESYFVWIPKYRYKIFDMGNYNTSPTITEAEYKENSKIIEIEFGLEDTTNDKEGECTTPNKSGEDGNCQVGDWMTHPAFLAFKNSKGMWVGKFETGYNQGDNNSNTIEVTDSWKVTGAEKDEEAPTKVIIKPNVYSWRSISLKKAYETSYNYQRELDSHMMKNTEWGAVAYLSHSKYGTCNTNSCKKVRINNSKYVTGYAAKEEPTIGYNAYKDYGTVILGQDADESDNFKGAYNYKNKASNIASTTGNYSGVYDMSGGVFEFTLGVAKDQDDQSLNFSSSGFNKDNFDLDKKYYDEYNRNGAFGRRILGDATGEMGPFFQIEYGTSNRRQIGTWDHADAWLPGPLHSFAQRGSSYMHGIESGIFAVGGANGTGTADIGISFRIVLTPTNEAM